MQLVAVLTMALLAAVCSVGHGSGVQMKHACFMMMSNETGIVSVKDQQLAAQCIIGDNMANVYATVRVSLTTDDTMIHITLRSKPMRFQRKSYFKTFMQAFYLEWGTGDDTYKLLMDVTTDPYYRYEFRSTFEVLHLQGPQKSQVFRKERDPHYNISLPVHDFSADHLLAQVEFSRVISYNYTVAFDLVQIPVRAEAALEGDLYFAYFEEKSGTPELLFPMVNASPKEKQLPLILIVCGSILLAVLVLLLIVCACRLSRNHGD